MANLKYDDSNTIFIKHKMKAPATEYDMMTHDDYETGIMAGNATCHEIILGDCIPYFDYDKTHKCQDDMVEDSNYVADEFSHALKGHYGAQAKIYVISACGKSPKGWRASLHFLVRNAGYYSSGAHLKQDVAGLLKEYGMDTQPYGARGSTRSVRTLGSTKEDGSRRLVEVELNADGELEPAKYLDTTNYQASLLNTMITNVAIEEPITIELEDSWTPAQAAKRDTKYEAPSTQVVRRVVMGLDSKRANSRSEQRDVIFALGDTGRQYDMNDELRDVAHEFSKQCAQWYNQYQVDQLYYDANVSKYQRPITFGSLIYKLGKDNPKEHAAIFKPAKSVSMDREEEAKSSMCYGKYQVPSIQTVRRIVMGLGQHQLCTDSMTNVVFGLGNMSRYQGEADALLKIAHEFAQRALDNKYNADYVDSTFRVATKSKRKNPYPYLAIADSLLDDNPDEYTAIFGPVDTPDEAKAAEPIVDGIEPRLEDLSPAKNVEEKDPAYKQPGEWHYADLKYFKRMSNQNREVDRAELNQYFDDSIVHAINHGNDIIFSRNRKPDGTVVFEPINKVPFQGKMSDFDIKVKGCGSSVSMSDLYREHYQNRCYDYIEFKPYLEKDTTASNVFNKFPGFKHPYKKLSDSEFVETAGKIQPILDHFKSIGGDHWELLLDMMCDIPQNGARKPKVCFVIKSQQGAGKNILFEFIMRTLGEGLCNMFQEIGQLTNKFNARLEGKMFNICNEVANFAGHKVADVLKARITDDDLTIELKGINTYQVKDYARYILLSNNDFCVRVEPGCRRYIVVVSDPSNIGNTKYFNKLAKCMENHEVDFWNYITNRDVSKFNPYMKAPMTDAKREILMDSVNSAIQFIIALGNGDVGATYQMVKQSHGQMIQTTHQIEFNETGELLISNKDLYGAYKTWSNDNLPGRNAIGARQFTKELGKIGMEKLKHRSNGTSINGFKVDKVTVEKYIGVYLRDNTFKFIN